MTEKRVSFNIDTELAYQLKKRALDEKTTQKELLTRWMKENLEKPIK